MNKIPTKERSKPSTFQWIRRNLFFIFGFGFIAALSIYGILSQTAKQPPAYYDDLLPPEAKIEQNAKTALSKVEALSKEISNRKSKPDSKSIKFTRHEINAWLKTRWLALRSEREKKVLKEFRIRLTEDQVTAIAHLKTKYFTGFLTTECKPSLGENKTLEIEVIKCYSGLARIPISQVRKQIISKIPSNFPKHRWPEGSQTISIDLSSLVTKRERRPIEILDLKIDNGLIEIFYKIL